MRGRCPEGSRCTSRQTIDFQRRPVDLLPPLFDVTLLWMSNDQLAVTGFERVDNMGDFTDFAHT